MQRAAPGDAEFRVVCGDCGAQGVIGADVLQPVRLAPDPRRLAA